MNVQQLYEFCLSKKGVTEHFPFDADTLVFKVGGKMFALSSLKDWEQGKPSINLKCHPEVAIELREKHSDVQPGYHMSKKHWNTVFINNELPDKTVLHFINQSYELVYCGLPKKVKEALNSH